MVWYIPLDLWCVESEATGWQRDGVQFRIVCHVYATSTHRFNPGLENRDFIKYSI